MRADYGVSDDCINHNSYGEICVNCGCCSNNPDYRDRYIRTMRYYKNELNELYEFEVYEDDRYREIQEKNKQSGIVYYKKQIRLYKKLLRTCKGRWRK